MDQAQAARTLAERPRSAPGFTYVQLVPQRIQVWKGQAEFSGRTVMRAGVWLDDPVDRAVLLRCSA
jgi:hypothetical protein